MTGLDIFAFLVMGVIVAAIAVTAIILGGLPGKIAAGRSHPQAEAVKMCGWIGVLTLGILWPVALIWAYMNPIRVSVSETPSDGSDRAIPAKDNFEETVGKLTLRVESLEAELAQAREREGGAGS